MIPLDGATVDQVELVCLEHLDVGFTAAPQEIARRQKEHLDHAIVLCLERPDFRWTIESIWQLEQWFERTPQAEERARLVELVKQGRIEIAAGFANLHTGSMDAPLLLRCFEPAERIRRELGVKIECCVQDDVPGFAALLPIAMAGSGVRYFLAGVNTAFGGGTSLGPGKNPFSWEGLDGSRVLTWVAHGSYTEAETIGLGVWSRDGEAETKLPAALTKLAASGYAFDRVLVMASTGDNGDPFAARSILRKVDAWNAAHERPRIAFTTPSAFLSRLEQTAIAATGKADGSFPVARGDWSGHWEMVKASAPAATALYREAQALLPGAEALSLRASCELGLPYPASDLDAALRNLLLYSEHSRPGGVGWPKLTTKDEVLADAHFTYGLAFDAAERLRAIVRRATDAYAEKLAADGASIVVANPTPFERSDEVATESRRGRAGPVPGWAVRRFPIGEFAEVGSAPSPRPSPSSSPSDDVALDEVPPDLFTFSKRGLGGGELAPLDLLRDGFRDAGSAGVGTQRSRFTWIELATDRAPDLAHDPVRLLERVQPFGAQAASTVVELRFTTAAGVVTPADFLPGSRPTAFSTTGGIELWTIISTGTPAGPRVARLLLREPFAFEPTTPRWLGPADLADAGTLWIRLLERAVRGETRDQGVVEFLRLEPSLDERRTFHVSLDVRDEPAGVPPGARDADLVRAAIAWRCPLVAREFTPWFPTAASAVGSQPLVETSAGNVLPLSCRPADGKDAAADVLVTVQEIGGIAASAVEIRLHLPGQDSSRRIDLRPHEVALLRFSRDE